MTLPSRLVVDIDGTLCPLKGAGEDYADLQPYPAMVERLREYRQQGFEIVLYTSRNVRTWNGNLGKINRHTLPKIVAWLERHGIPCDELYVGKPWPGAEGFYVDDRSIRPDEFLRLDHSGILALVGRHGD